MKHKLDFVTNSSSTSVVMWGVYLDESEIRENETMMEKIKELAKKEDMEEEFESEGIIYVIGSVLTAGFNLDTYSDYNGDGIYIGKSPFAMTENETPKQFKEEIKKRLQEIGINKEIEQIVESWMDG